MQEHLVLPLVLINLLGLAGIIVWHLQGKNRPNARLVIQIFFFAAMTAVLVFNGILPHRLEEPRGEGITAVLGMSARVLWWTLLPGHSLDLCASTSCWSAGRRKRA